MLSPEDDAIRILSFAENACDEGGRNKFAVFETKRSSRLCKKTRTKQQAIGHMNAKQNRLLVAVECKHKLKNGASDEIQGEFLMGALVVEEKTWR